MFGTLLRRWNSSILSSIPTRLRARYSWRVRVHLLYFGVLRDMFGVAGEQVEMAGPGTVGELLRILRGRTSNDSMGNETGHGLDERLWRSLAVAVNREYAMPDAALRDGDEVALLPPVSGGAGGQ